ncbi:TetR/AcrR family transcriptional regulator [Georgenia deserti]|uniref:TetR/AcrR family transcriptional regulator n=1 Tax=Georgenia deserti TaxID=2093781 RepID=A0ABW4L5J4_9MICO
MSSTSARSSRAGRPRDAAIDSAVLSETLAALAEDGYSHFSLEQVARAAGTSKPAIYRRWPTRQHLALAALANGLGQVEPPDTACTMCDLAESLILFVEAFRRMPPDVLAPLLADCAGDEALRQAFMSTLFDPPREAVRHTLSRASERGDLREDLDLDLAVDLLGSFIHYRVLFGHAGTSAEEIEATVETVLQGLAVDYECLVGKAREHDVAAETHAQHGS